MISQETINRIRDFTISQTEEYKTPLLIHLEIANEKGQELAGLLGADKNIVLLGTLLMDCMIGLAIKEGKRERHVEMGVKKTKELLNQFLELTSKEKENIIHCVAEHHGVGKFFSEESEIVCNADCYRFVSAKGFIGGIRFFRDMDFKELLKLLSSKTEEKWNALSLDVCKKELEPEYQAIKILLSALS